MYKEYGYYNDADTFVMSYITEPLLQCLGNRKDRVILDMGCGNGALARLLLQKGYNVYGTDASPQGVAIAKKSYPDKFFLQDISKDELPVELQHKKFDTIISTEVIEHLYDPGQFIEFSKKILLKNGGGELILTTPYHGYFKNLIISILGKWDSHADPLWIGGHIKFWSRKSLTKLLESQGFKVTDFKGCGRYLYFWKSMLIKAVLT